MYVNGNSVPYFDTLGDEHIPEEIKRFIDNKYLQNTGLWLNNMWILLH